MKQCTCEYAYNDEPRCTSIRKRLKKSASSGANLATCAERPCLNRLFKHGMEFGIENAASGSIISGSLAVDLTRKDHSAF